MNLRQVLVGKGHAAKSLVEFIRYFSNWSEIWSAYRAGKSLPPLVLRGKDKPTLVQHGAEDHPIFLFREIFIERAYTPTWFYQPSRHDTVIDVGANIGVFMLYLAWRSPGIHVHCFEPSFGTRRRLETQVRANGLEEMVRVYPYALSDKAGVATLKLSEHSAYQSFFDSELVGEKEEVVQMLSLEDALEMCAVEDVNLLKLDVEGAEIEIVESAATAVWKRIQRVVCEYHDSFRPGCRERVCKCLTAVGFNNIQVRTWSPTDNLGIIYAKR